jgi:hypothetical protein
MKPWRRPAKTSILRPSEMKSQRRKLPLRRGLMGFLLMLMVVVAKFLIAMAVLTLRAPVELGNP